MINVKYKEIGNVIDVADLLKKEPFRVSICCQP